MVGMTKTIARGYAAEGILVLRGRAGLHRVRDDRGISAGPRRRADRRRHPARPRRHAPTRSPRSSAGSRPTRRPRRPAASSTSTARAMFASLAARGRAADRVPLGKPRPVEQPLAPIETPARLAPRARIGRLRQARAAGPDPRQHLSTSAPAASPSILITVAPGPHPDRRRHRARRATSIAANIRAARLQADGRQADLLHSHEHFDHVGGIAELQQLTGAHAVSPRRPQRRCSRPARRRRDDPQVGMHQALPAGAVSAASSRTAKSVRLGDICG